MTTFLQDARNFIETEKLTLAARNLKYLLRLQSEQASLPQIVQSLERTLREAEAGKPRDFADILTTQARILDAAFHYYIEESNSPYSGLEKVNTALKAQRQTRQTIMSWKMLTRLPEDKKNPETN